MTRTTWFLKLDADAIIPRHRPFDFDDTDLLGATDFAMFRTLIGQPLWIWGWPIFARWLNCHQWFWTNERFNFFHNFSFRYNLVYVDYILLNIERPQNLTADHKLPQIEHTVNQLFPAKNNINFY